MSDLEALCRALEASVQPLPALSEDLRHRAVRLRALASEVDRAARLVEHGPDVRHVVQGLHQAAEAMDTSGQALSGAVQHCRSFVSRTIGQNGTALAPSGQSSSGTPSGDGLDRRLQRIYVNESFTFTKGAGRFFLAEGDDFTRVVDTMPAPSDGSYLAMIHGAPDRVAVGNDTLSALELAALIGNDPNYQEGQSVTLFSCSTGQDPLGFAKQLARALNCSVTAPSSLAWLPPEPDGSILITPMNPTTRGPVLDRNGKGLGEWRRFEPTGN